MTASSAAPSSLARSQSLSNALSPMRARIDVGDQRLDTDAVVTLAGQKHEANQIAERVDQGHDLGRQAAARAADGLILSPPFAPVPCWWTRTSVPSMRTYSKSGSSESLENPLPDALLRPAPEARIDGEPLAEFRQITPRRGQRGHVYKARWLPAGRYCRSRRVCRGRRLIPENALSPPSLRGFTQPLTEAAENWLAAQRNGEHAVPKETHQEIRSASRIGKRQGTGRHVSSKRSAEHHSHSL